VREEVFHDTLARLPRCKAVGEGGLTAEVLQALPHQLKELLRACMRELLTSPARREERLEAWSAAAAFLLRRVALPQRLRGFREITLHAQIQKLYLRCLVALLSDAVPECDSRFAQVCGGATGHRASAAALRARTLAPTQERKKLIEVWTQ
jgi:hypothetical protein